MNNKRFIILISVAAIIIVGIFGFMFYFSVIKGPEAGSPSSPIELTDFGSTTPNQPGSQLNEDNFRSETTDTEGEIISVGVNKLRKISEIPVVGAVSFEKERLIEGLPPLSFTFSNDLKLNDENADVKSLQIFLNSIADSLNSSLPTVGPIAKTGAGSPGKEGMYFGPATKEALIRFQNKYPEEILTPAGLKTGDGIFAGATRQKINSLLANAPGELIAKLTGPVKQTESLTALRYVDQLAGNIYETFADNLNEKRVSNTQIFGVHEAIFANQGQNVALRYLKSDGKTIESFMGTIKNEVLGGDSSIELNGYFLPENVLGLSSSPDGKNIFYVFKSNNGVVGINSALESGKNTQIFDSAFSEWLVEWPNSRLITLATKPSYASPGFIYSLDPSDGTQNKILGGIQGLTAKISPDGKIALYAGSDLSLKIYDITNKTSNDLGLKSLPEKCVWSNNNIVIYCAVPKEIPNGNYPDSWYQGEVSFNDEIWKIDTTTNAFSLLDDLSADAGENIDVINLFLDAFENNLFFINKNNSILWNLPLN